MSLSRRPHNAGAQVKNINMKTGLGPAQKLPEKVFAQLTNINGEAKVGRVLIANRGEIACRVITTCRKLDIVSIVVYTEPDTLSLHVKEADEAVPLGPIDSVTGNPHQNIDLLVSLAIRHNADAIHPGYGYLSENPEFSKALQEAGLLFLGPSPESMAVLGDKRLAKEYLTKHAPHIPLIPGYNGADQSIEKLLVEADQIGFPVLIKASAGGGGKGMRIVSQRDQLEVELTRAQSEAKRSFGSSDCILERYIKKSKHIEIQIFGDRHGVVVSLLDRECSIQRRHQKVIEEAPSPWLSQKLREEISATAISIGNLLNYESAGTVEFIVDVETAEFFFLEVNTRIQVEHPITEETTGLDIVALQIYVASGGKLEDLDYFVNNMAPQVGHAIECRLCAEDPARDFLPDLGIIRRWTPASAILPQLQTQHVRFETGIETGSEVSIYFDSLIAKIVVWAPTRAQAITKLAKMLANTVCIGIRSNQSFLQSCLLHPSFQEPTYSTNFIPELLPTLLQNAYVPDVPALLQKISFLPSLLRLRNFQSSGQPGGRRRPFSTIRLGYRNQSTDTANATAEIVQIRGQHEQAFIIEWLSTLNQAGTRHVNIVPVTKSSIPPNKQLKPGLKLALDYNALSSQIRGIKSSNDSATSHKVSVGRLDTGTLNAPSFSGQWQISDVRATVGLETYKLHIVSSDLSDSNDVAAFQTVYAHIPALGTYYEFRLYSLLTYGESLRTIDGADGALATENPKAPMPCRVLDVTKKDGEKIAIGEVGMIVESMKMEMKILATTDGIFEGRFKKGDAVAEGTILFIVKQAP